MHDEGATSTTTIFANIFISFIGAGILGMPYAFKVVKCLIMSMSSLAPWRINSLNFIFM